MNTLSNLELLTVLSFGIPFLFIALAVIFYIMSLKSDNAYLRNCLDKNRAQRQEDRLTLRQEIESLRERISKLKTHLNKAEQESELQIIPDRPIRTLKYSLTEFAHESEASKKAGLNALYTTIGEQVYGAAKIDRFRNPYTKGDFEYNIEIKVLDLIDEKKH